MSQVDWIGAPSAPKTFRDIRNTRPSVAEEKAALVMQLGNLINKAPPSVISGSIGFVREWTAARNAAAKVAASKRASIHELTAAISNMRRFE